MADIGQASRFSVLKDQGSRRVKKKVTSPQPQTTDTKTKLKKTNVTSNTKTGGKNETTNVAKKQPKVLPVGLNFKTKKKTASKATIDGKQTQKNKPGKKDVEFAKKYEEAEAREFVKNLEQAILESKLNYEENKEYYDTLKQTTKVDEATTAAATSKNRKKKSKSKVEEPISNGVNFNNANTKPVEEEVAEEPFITKKEKKQKKTATKPKFPERDTTDVRLLQCRAELEEKDKQISKLVSEANQMKEEIGNLKKVNMKFCSILEKVKDKVDSILMVEELIKVKDELTQEVTSLHVSLEQERSKVHSLQLQLRAQGGRKDSK